MEDTKDQPPNRTGEWGDDFIPHWRTYCRKRLLDIITVILVILAAILGQKKGRELVLEIRAQRIVGPMPEKNTKTDYLKFAVLIALILLIESCINPDKPVWKLILEFGGNK